MTPCSFASRLRRGHEKIVSCRGLLETARKGLGTKIAYWMPIAGGVIPDETQGMRIRLQVALADGRSGLWDVVSPKPFRDRSACVLHARVLGSGPGNPAQGKGIRAAAWGLVKRQTK